GQTGEERGPELAVAFASVGDGVVVIDVVFGDESVQQGRVVRVGHLDEHGGGRVVRCSPVGVLRWLALRALATLTVIYARVNSTASYTSDATIQAWLSRTVGSASASPVASSSRQQHAAWPRVKAGMRSPRAGCPPRSSTASRCCTSISGRWRTSSTLLQW